MGPPPAPSARSLRGLDWFVFCVADVQTGFGPFVAVYLTTQKWTQGDIGLVLSAAGLVALVGQMPGGALVDAIRSERLLAGLAITTIAFCALTYAVWPTFAVVLTAAILHAAASCILGPAIAAISLGLVGHAAIAERLGRNARFASIGNGLAAGAMGACGYVFSARAVFIVTALLLVPTLLAIRCISAREINPDLAHGGIPARRAKQTTAHAAVLTGPRKIEMREFALPEIGPDDGLLRVEANGLCGTDYDQYLCEFKIGGFGKVPIIPGHETDRLDRKGRRRGRSTLEGRRGRPGRGQGIVAVWEVPAVPYRRNAALRTAHGLRSLSDH